MSFGIAIIKCSNCQYTFTQQPGPVGDNKVPGCPKCNHMYLNWINYSQWHGSFLEHLKLNPNLVAERIAYGIQ